jgi:Rrf2 family protein
MITKTSILATRALVCLARDQDGGAISPRSIALQLGESRTYMAKVLRSLVKAGLLRAEHGSKGGVRLNRAPEEITLLAIVEACQGAIVGSYCEDIDDIRIACAFHHAAVELREAIVSVLSKWHLADIAKSPGPAKCLPEGKHCFLVGLPLSSSGRVEEGLARKRNTTS